MAEHEVSGKTYNQKQKKELSYRLPQPSPDASAVEKHLNLSILADAGYRLPVVCADTSSKPTRLKHFFVFIVLMHIYKCRPFYFISLGEK